MKDIESPAITVLMSVHNGALHLTEALESILGQTYPDFEYIIIDDASTDDTPRILSLYTDPRIKIFTNPENLGLTKSLNKGIREARGTYIARMDADDISLPERLARQKEFLDTHPEIACVGTGSIIINNSGKEIGKKSPSANEPLFAFHMMLKNQMTHPSIMIRTALIKKYGGYKEELPYAQDYDLWSRMLADGQRLTNITTPLLRYRFHAHSITQGTKSNQAYLCATQTIRTNLLRYVPDMPQKTFEAFLQSFHKHQANSLSDVLSVRAFLKTFLRAYIAQEHPSTQVLREIENYIATIRTQALQWYVKKRFNVLYRIIKHL